jgi:hypothetical protein
MVFAVRLIKRTTHEEEGTYNLIIKEPLDIDYDNDTIEEIVEKVEYAIEQHASFLKVIPAEEIKEQEELNKLRKWEY